MKTVQLGKFLFNDIKNEIYNFNTFRFYSPQQQRAFYPNDFQNGYSYHNANLFNPYQNNPQFNYNYNSNYANTYMNPYFFNKDNSEVHETSFNTRNEISMIIPNQRKNDCLNELLEK